MSCIKITVGGRPGFLCGHGIAFKCPYCKKVYPDANERYQRRAEKRGYTTVKCTCGKRFGMAVDMTGRTVAFTNGIEA